jgi:hypothetical protein
MGRISISPFITMVAVSNETVISKDRGADFSFDIQHLIQYFID